MTRAKDISKIVTDADLSGTLDVTGTVTAGAVAVEAASAAQITITDNSPSTVSLYMGAGNSSVSIGSTTSDPVTFLTANTERMRILSGGNVGIGTSSPSQKLDVNGTIVASTIASQGARIERNGTTGGANFDSVLASGSLHFRTGATERMLIDSSGNVGIGTTNPESLLTIGGNVITTLKPTVAISDTTNGGTMTLRGQSPVMFFDCTSSGVGKILTDGQGLEIKDGTLDSQGNVDFKIASSGYLEATSGSQVRLTLGSEGTAGTNTSNWIRGNGTSLGFNSAGGGYQWEIGGGEYMRIDSSGRVGIGDTSPQRKLSVNGIAKFRNTITLGGSNSSTDYNAYFANEAYANNASDSTVTLGTHSTRPLIFATNTTERMRIDSSGNVGIGTSSPATYGKLAIQVDGTTSPTTAGNVKGSSVNLYAATNGGSTDNTVGIFGWQAGQPGLGSGIGFSRENSGSWGTQIRFYTHPTTTSNISDITERMRITSSGRAVFYQTTSSVTQRYDTSSYASMYVSRFAMSMIGNQSYTITFGGFTNGMYHFNCFASHWNGAYTLYRNSYMGLQSSALFSEYNLHNRSSGNQGAFSFTNPSSAKIAVVKSAGTYVGGMTAIIEIKGPALLNIDSVA